MYRCCIFDLDGTLLNTLKSLQNTVNATLAHFELGPLDEAHIKQFVGDGYQMLVERTLKYCGDKELVHYEKALTVYMKEFAIHSMDEVRPYDGIPAILEHFKQQGVIVAVLSNKPHEKTVYNITEVFGEGYLDYIAGERPEVKRKPDPEGVFAIMKAFDLKPEECLYIGDTSTDMETGIAAGVDTIGVLWGFRERAELSSYQPAFLVEDPMEIVAIVKSKQ